MKAKVLLAVILMLVAFNAFATPDTLTVVQIDIAGDTPNLAAVSDDTLRYINNGKTFIRIANTGSEATATIVSLAGTNLTLPAGAAASNTTVTIPATTGDKMIGPFPVQSYSGSASTSGYMTVVLSTTSNITVEVYKL